MRKRRDGGRIEPLGATLGIFLHRGTAELEESVLALIQDPSPSLLRPELGDEDGGNGVLLLGCELGCFLEGPFE